MLPQQYCLRWKHHSTNVQSMFSQLLEKERFCDVTVCSGGVSVRCHRAVLAAGSPLLGALLAAHDALAEPVLVIDQAEPRHLRPLLRYLYTGEMSVHHSQLAGLLKTAEELRIKGLSDIKWSSGKGPQAQPTATATATEESGPARWDAAEPVRTEARTDASHSVNGGPPPLIKLPVASPSPARKRELTNEPDEAGPGSPKRSRMPSRSDNTDEEEREPEWAHGHMEYGSEKAGSDSEPEDGGSESETDFPPQDLARFLDTRLRVDGEHVAGEDEDSKGADEKKMDGPKQTTSGVVAKACAATTSSSSCNSSGNASGVVTNNSVGCAKPGSSADPRFSDVVKLNDYLLHGRRPHFWEEDYVRRVMEAVRLKELEMKQAAEILGVSYGTLYGRYRDVYGCINRPYRIKEFWSESSPAEVVQRVARGEVSLGQAADALAVPPQQLAAYITSLPAGGGSGGTGTSSAGGAGTGAGRSAASSGGAAGGSEDVGETSPEEPPSGLRALRRTVAAGEKALKKLLVTDQDKPSTTPNKVPSIRVASLESLRGTAAQPNSVTADSTSPAAALLRTRPDLTIVPRGKPRLDSVT